MCSDVIPFPRPRCDVEECFRPLIVERLMPAVYRRVPISPYFSGEDLIEMAQNCCVREKRRLCLVLGSASCWYMEPDGSMEWSDCPPSGGFVIEA